MNSKKIGLRQLYDQSLRALGGTTLRVAGVLLSLAFGIYATRLIGVESFGNYVSLMAIAGLVTTALSLGLPTMITREVAGARGRGESGVVIPLLDLAATVVVIIGILALSLGFYFGFALALVLLFALIGNASSLVGAVHAGRERMLFGAVVGDFIKPVVAISILALFGLLGMATTQTAIVAQIVGATTALFVFLLALEAGSIGAAVRAIKFWPKWSGAHARFLRTGIVVAGTQLLINATTQIDILILTALREPEDVAHYFAAARAALVVSFFFGISAAFAEPRITRLYAEENLVEMRRVVGSTAVMGFGFNIIASLGAVVLGPLYLSFYGPSFSSAYEALLLLLTGLIGWTACGPAQIVLRATHRDKLLLKATLFSVAINAFVSWLLVPSLGIKGAAIGTAVQFLLYGVILASATFQVLKLRSDIFQLDPWRQSMSRLVVRN